MKLVTYRCREGVVHTGVVVEDQVLDIDAWLSELPIPVAIKTYCASSGMQPAQGGMLRLLQAGSAALSELQRHVGLALGTRHLQREAGAAVGVTVAGAGAAPRQDRRRRSQLCRSCKGNRRRTV